MASGSSFGRQRSPLATGVVTLVLFMASAAGAQNAGPPPQQGNPFVRLATGDCLIHVQVAEGANLAMAQLLRNDHATTAVPRLKRTTGNSHIIEFRVEEPPFAGEVFTVTFPPPTSALTSTVARIGPDRTRCGPNDDRGTFEPTFLLGLSADAFAPNERENYPANTNYELKTSLIVRFEGQLRLGDKHGSWLDRVWLGVAMKYGVRSTDLDCDGSDEKSPLCNPGESPFQPPPNVPGTVTAVVLRASKIEAIFKPRYEFLTLHPDSALPLVIFASGRIGFGQAPDEVKVENIYSAGAGILFPAGPFRESGFEVTWGVDRGYRTNPGGVRTRSDFRLLVGAPAGITAQLPFLSKLGRSMRALIEVVIDRNSFGPGPDGTQTYLGVVLDAGQLLR